METHNEQDKCDCISYMPPALIQYGKWMELFVNYHNENKKQSLVVFDILQQKGFTSVTFDIQSQF